MGILGEFVGAVGVLQRSFRMPATGFVFAFFIVLSSSTVSLCRKFVLLGCFSVRILHLFLASSRSLTCTTPTIPT